MTIVSLPHTPHLSTCHVAHVGMRLPYFSPQSEQTHNGYGLRFIDITHRLSLRCLWLRVEFFHVRFRQYHQSNIACLSLCYLRLSIRYKPFYQRSTASLKILVFNSLIIHLRLSISATFPVVPLPAKQSNTVSFS